MITLLQQSKLASEITEQVKMAAIKAAKDILDADITNAMFYGSQAAYDKLTGQAQRITSMSANGNRGIINALSEIIAAGATSETLSDADIQAAVPGAIEKLAGLRKQDKDVRATIQSQFEAGKWVDAGAAIIYNGKRYLVNQSHRMQAGWEPDKAPALFRPADIDAATGYPVWVQPQGAHDAYKKDAIVTHKGENWTNQIDANVWEPGVYGWVKAA